MIIFLFKEQSSAIADGSSDVFSSNYFSYQVSDLEEAVEEDTAENRDLRVVLSDGDILLLNENGYYTITSKRTAISEVVWESIAITYNNETKVFVDSKAYVVAH